MDWVIRSTDTYDTERIGRILGKIVKAPETIELRSDLGGGKTTLVRGLVKGLGSSDKVGSPTFTINKVYKVGRQEIHHFDFYRLTDAGIVSEQLAESLNNPRVVTVIEWGDTVENVLPKERVRIELKAVVDNPNERILTFSFPVSKLPVVELLRTELSEVKS